MAELTPLICVQLLNRLNKPMVLADNRSFLLEEEFLKIGQNIHFLWFFCQNLTAFYLIRQISTIFGFLPNIERLLFCFWRFFSLNIECPLFPVLKTSTMLLRCEKKTARTFSLLVYRFFQFQMLLNDRRTIYKRSDRKKLLLNQKLLPSKK